jgi:hypothetical protein
MQQAHHLKSEVVMKDFDTIQPVIEDMLKLVEDLDTLLISDLSDDAKDYLVSQIKQSTGVLTRFLIKNDKKLLIADEKIKK